MPSLGGRDAPPGQSGIDRDPRNIALPTQQRVVRQKRRTPMQIKWWRSNAPNILAAIGLTAAVTGAYLTLTQPSVPVFTKSNTVQVGPCTLKTTDQITYTGCDSVMIIVDKSVKGDLDLLAVSSSTSHGKNVAGRCYMTHQRGNHLIHETCDFWISVKITGPPSYSSADTFDTAAPDHVWHRRYSDGEEVQILVPADSSVAPVPFPVGR